MIYAICIMYNDFIHIAYINNKNVYHFDVFKNIFSHVIESNFQNIIPL